MGNIFKINCRELYSMGMYFNTQANELEKIITNIKKINEDIKSSWDGNDYDAFFENYNLFLTSIKDIEKSIIDEANLFKEIAIKHNRVDKEILNNLNWRNNNEK